MTDRIIQKNAQKFYGSMNKTTSTFDLYGTAFSNGGCRGSRKYTT